MILPSHSISFSLFLCQVADSTTEVAEEVKSYSRYKYPRMVKKQGGFKLTVEPGEFTDSQIVVMLGENGTGKTTFIRMLVSFSYALVSACECW